MWLILTLLITSITAGLVIGPRYNVYMLVIASPVIALVSATATRLYDFTFWEGSATTFACVSAMQLAYMLVTWWHVGPELSPQEPRHDPMAIMQLDHYDVRLLSLDEGRGGAQGNRRLALGGSEPLVQFLIRRRGRILRADKKSRSVHFIAASGQHRRKR